MFGMHIDGLDFALAVLAIIVVYLGVRWIIRRISIHEGCLVQPKAGYWDGTRSPIEYGRTYTVEAVSGDQIIFVGLNGSYPLSFFKKA